MKFYPFSFPPVVEYMNGFPVCLCTVLTCTTIGLKHAHTEPLHACLGHLGPPECRCLSRSTRAHYQQMVQQA